MYAWADHCYCNVADDLAVVDGEDDDEDEGLGLRQSSGMGHMGDGTEDGDLGRSRKRRGLKGSRPTGKARRRRLDEEDEHMEEVRIAKRRKRGTLVTPVFASATRQTLQYKYTDLSSRGLQLSHPS